MDVRADIHWRRLGPLQGLVLYLSRCINEDKAEYYRRLRVVTEREEFREALREASSSVNADLLDLLFEQACIRVKGWWTPPESRVPPLRSGCVNWLRPGC